MSITIPIRPDTGAARTRLVTPAGATLTSLPPLSVYVHAVSYTHLRAHET